MPLGMDIYIFVPPQFHDTNIFTQQFITFLTPITLCFEPLRHCRAVCITLCPVVIVARSLSLCYPAPGYRFSISHDVNSL